MLVSTGGLVSSIAGNTMLEVLRVVFDADWQAVSTRAVMSDFQIEGLFIRFLLFLLVKHNQGLFRFDIVKKYGLFGGILL